MRNNLASELSEGARWMNKWHALTHKSSKISLRTMSWCQKYVERETKMGDTWKQQTDKHKARVYTKAHAQGDNGTKHFLVAKWLYRLSVYARLWTRFVLSLFDILAEWTCKRKQRNAPTQRWRPRRHLKRTTRSQAHDTGKSGEK